MADEDLLNTVLADLKRTVREYTTAATESNCPTVRRVFNDLTMDTLRLQGDLYNQMSQLIIRRRPNASSLCSRKLEAPEHTIRLREYRCISRMYKVITLTICKPAQQEMKHSNMLLLIRGSIQSVHTGFPG
jgi:hypothetical protein